MKDKKPTRFLYLLALVLGIVLATSRIVLSRTALEKGIELYAHHTPLVTAMHIAILLCTVGLCLAGILLYLPEYIDVSAEERRLEKEEAARRKAEKAAQKRAYAALHAGEALARRYEDKQEAARKERQRAQKRYERECARMEKAFARPSLFVTFAGIFLGIMLILYAVMQFIGMAGNDFRALAPLLGRAPLGKNSASSVLSLLHLISALPAAMYCFKAATTLGKPSAGFGILASAPAIWSLLSTLILYFEMDVAFNSPTKLLRLSALVVFMLWQVQEGRMLLGVPKRSLFAGFGSAAMLLTLVCGISDLVLYAMGVITLGGGYIEAAVFVALGMYAAARCLQNA